MEIFDSPKQTEVRAIVTLTALTGSHFYWHLKEMSKLTQLSLQQ